MFGFWFFMFYWVLIWTLTNEAITFRSWGIQFSLIIIQEVFVNQPIKIFVIHVLVISLVRPQLRQIFSVLKHFSLSRLDNYFHSNSILGNNDEQDHIYTDVRVVQHLSAACRAARTNGASQLPSSKLLMQLGDYEIAMCREMRFSALNFMIVFIIGVPALIAFTNEQIQNMFVDLMIPAAWNAFLLVNILMLAISPGLLVAVYLVICAFILYKFYLLRRVRKKYLNSTSTRHQGLRGWRGPKKKSLLTKDSLLHTMDSIVLFLFKSFARKTTSTTFPPIDLIWRNMNLSMNLQAKVSYGLLKERGNSEEESVKKLSSTTSLQSERSSVDDVRNIILRQRKPYFVRGKIDILADSSNVSQRLWGATRLEDPPPQQVHHLYPAVLALSNDIIRSERWKEQRREEIRMTDLSTEYAKELFMSLDEGKDGYLDGKEIENLTKWVWENFYSGTPTSEELDEVLDKLLLEMDINIDDHVSFATFSKWFNHSCDALIQKQQQKADEQPFLYRII